MINERTKQQTKQQNGGFNMFKTIKKQLKNEKGLTLIELLAVIVILAIIAAIAIPAIGNIITNSKYNAVKSDAINIINAAQLYYLDNPDGETGENGLNTKDSITVTQLKELDYLDNAGHFGEASDAASVSNKTPSALTSDKIIFTTGKDVKFTNATIEDINKDSEKGSKLESDHVIGTTP